MKSILFILILFISFSNKAYSYPENQMNDCISTALANPSTRNISDNSIKKYCDCALTAIIDKKGDIRESGYECALKFFN